VMGSHDLAGVSCPRTMRHVPPGPGAGQASAQCRSGGGEVVPGSLGGGSSGLRTRSRPARVRSSSGIDSAARLTSQRVGGLTASSTGSAIRGL
jgi:hypothetical protein